MDTIQTLDQVKCRYYGEIGTPERDRLESELRKSRSKVIEERRAKVSPEVKSRVGMSFMIADRIHAILEEKGLRQKDLAEMLGKRESEVIKWMRGTHNFTIDTIASIETALGMPILEVVPC